MARTSAISDEVWANAIRAVMVDKMSLRAAAHKFGVHHMSLHRRIKDIRGDVKPKSRQAAALPAPQQAYAAAPMQSGMSMVNMMHMNMDRETKQPYAPLRHMPYEAKPAVLRPFPGIENAAGHNISNVDKAVEAVESGQLDVMQAAVAFKLDANELYDHLRRRHAGDEYLRPADESGLLKVVIARAELGVKMTYDEVVDLIRRVLYRYGQTSGTTLNHIVSVFFRRNDNVLRTALEAAMQQEDMGYKYAQAQRPAAMLPPPKVQDQVEMSSHNFGRDMLNNKLRERDQRVSCKTHVDDTAHRPICSLHPTKSQSINNSRNSHQSSTASPTRGTNFILERLYHA